MFPKQLTAGRTMSTVNCRARVVALSVRQSVDDVWSGSSVDRPTVPNVSKPTALVRRKRRTFLPASRQKLFNFGPASAVVIT